MAFTPERALLQESRMSGINRGSFPAVLIRREPSFLLGRPLVEKFINFFEKRPIVPLNEQNVRFTA